MSDGGTVGLRLGSPGRPVCPPVALGGRCVWVGAGLLSRRVLALGSGGLKCEKSENLPVATPTVYRETMQLTQASEKRDDEVRHSRSLRSRICVISRTRFDTTYDCPWSGKRTESGQETCREISRGVR